MDSVDIDLLPQLGALSELLYREPHIVRQAKLIELLTAQFAMRGQTLQQAHQIADKIYDHVALLIAEQYKPPPEVIC